MFTDEEPDFCQREYKSSILTMFMRIDRRFMAKCFGQMQELGIYPGTDTGARSIGTQRRTEPARDRRKLHIKPPTVNVTVQRLEKRDSLQRSR